MKRSHIAFISFPHHPHVNPTLPVVSVLARRGYRVSYATSDRFANRVSALGAEIVTCPSPFDSSLDAERGALACDEHSLVTLATRTLDVIEPFYEENRPSLIVYDAMALAGRVLARRWKVPAVQTDPSFAHDIVTHGEQVKNAAFRKEIVESGREIDRGLRRLGLNDNAGCFYREGLNIYLFPKALQPCADSIDATCFFAGRCAGEQPYYGGWKRRDTGQRPIALVATSTTYVQGPGYFRMCIEALSSLNWHVILSIGDAGDPKELGTLPPNFEIVQGTSHVKILPYVDLFICLAGIITSSEAMYHGIPLVVTSLGFPELEWEADNLESLGLAIQVKKNDMNASTLRAAVIEASEGEAIRCRVKQVQGVVRQEPGGEETANRIEAYLESRSVHGVQ